MILPYLIDSFQCGKASILSRCCHIAWVEVHIFPEDIILLELFSGCARLTSTYRHRLNIHPDGSLVLAPQPSLTLRIQRAEVVDAPECWFQAGSCLRGCSLALPRQWYDWEGRGGDNDFLSTTGFLWALRDTLRLRRGALLWGGLPCCRSLESNMDGQWHMLSIQGCDWIILLFWTFWTELDLGVVWHPWSLYFNIGWPTSLLCTKA